MPQPQAARVDQRHEHQAHRSRAAGAASRPTRGASRGCAGRRSSPRRRCAPARARRRRSRPPARRAARCRAGRPGPESAARRPRPRTARAAPCAGRPARRAAAVRAVRAGPWESRGDGGSRCAQDSRNVLPSRCHTTPLGWPAMPHHALLRRAIPSAARRAPCCGAWSKSWRSRVHASRCEHAASAPQRDALRLGSPPAPSRTRRSGRPPCRRPARRRSSPSASAPGRPRPAQSNRRWASASSCAVSASEMPWNSGLPEALPSEAISMRLADREARMHDLVVGARRPHIPRAWAARGSP